MVSCPDKAGTSYNLVFNVGQDCILSGYGEDKLQTCPTLLQGKIASCPVLRELVSPLEYKLFHQRHLPHYQPPGATLFVTFRLAGSVPTQLLNGFSESDQADQVEKIDKRLFGSWDQTLHSWNEGPAWLQDQRIASLVSDSLHYGDGKYYDLEAYCLMPNHVHLLFSPKLKSELEYYSLSEITHKIKRFTARDANKILGRTGDFWQHESWDHVVRDDAEKKRIIDYILNNPVKAGLVDDWKRWKWIYCKYEPG